MKFAVVFLAPFLITTAFAAAPSPVLEVFLPQPAGPQWWPRSGEKWLAIFQAAGTKKASGEKFESKQVQSKIYVDSRDGVLKLGAQNSPDPIVFISGLASKPGPIEISSSLKTGVPLAISDSMPLIFDFKGKAWTLARKTLGVIRSNPDSTDVGAKYTLTSGSTTFDLGEAECRISIRTTGKECQEPITLHLIGDIDHDGIPDIYFQTQSAVATTQVWLSTLKSAAKLAVSGAKPDLIYHAQTRRSGKDAGLSDKIPGLLVADAISPTQNSAYSLDQWYAVESKTDKTHLDSTAIWVACPSALRADGTCEETTLIAPSKNIDAKFLVRGIPGLKIGDAPTAKMTELPIDPSRDDAFPSYEIEMNGIKSKLSGGQGIFSLESPVRTVVFPVKLQDPDHKPKLVWAGDLNHDGKLDLYFDVKEDDSINHLLFISPDAATGPIAGPTTQFCTGPCY